MRFLIVAALLFGACGALATPDSGIGGTVLAGPACPGPARLDSACPDRPVRLTVDVVQGTTVTATFNTDTDGKFSVAVPAGTYTLRSKTGLPALRSQSVTVAAGTYTEVVLHADTGIR